MYINIIQYCAIFNLIIDCDFIIIGSATEVRVSAIVEPRSGSGQGDYGERICKSILFLKEMATVPRHLHRPEDI